DIPHAQPSAAGPALDSNEVNQSSLAAAETNAKRDAMPSENGIPERTIFNRPNALDEPMTRHDLASGFAKPDPRSRESAAGRLSESSDRLHAALHEDKRVQENSAPDGHSASLHSLFSEMARRAEPMPAAGAAQASTAPEGPAHADQTMLENMVERILVSAPEQGSHEVRLTLNAQFLHGTDIVLNRDAAGALSVTLQANDPSAFQTLVAAQGELKQLLETQERAEVRVTVTDNTPQEQNDSRQHSRGYAGYEPDER
ncbi:MAG: hypothetical protein J5828_04935, partial [Desulfovibrionaceae bacterium]|nr:hypothetical protein [Desulfovibrionaceae bacterium]